MKPVFLSKDRNRSTFGFSVLDHNIAVEVGDAKKKRFYPRIKLLKWNNEANLSIGLADTKGVYKQTKQKITFENQTVKAIFEPNVSQRKFDTSAIRYVDSGKVSSVRISSLYELDRQHKWTKQTVTVCRPDQLVIGYFGTFPKTQYVDPALVDIAECRIASYTSQPTDPMAGDDTMWLIDVHYDPRRDNIKKMQESMVSAIRSVLERYGIKGITGNDSFLKLYFDDEGKQVKFLSSGFFDGHYFLYVNLGFDYHLAHKYLRKDLKPPTMDKYAYGLRSVGDVPDKAIDEIVQQYAKNYGLPLQRDKYDSNEERTLNYLDDVLANKDWIDNAERNDVFSINSYEGEEEGVNMDFEFTDKPLSNKIDLTLRSKNMLYFRQEKRVSQNILMSPRVAGSYAVYHAEGKEHNEYKTGKAFHIYRPWAEDANKKRVWCDLQIPTNEKGELTDTRATITIPQDFLDSAAYPVFVDPTFGYSGIGANQITALDLKGSVLTTPINADITINTIQTYVGAFCSQNDSFTIYWTYGFYRGNNLLSSTPHGSYPGTFELVGWVPGNFTTPVKLSAKDRIIMCAAFRASESNQGYGVSSYQYFDYVANNELVESTDYYETANGVFTEFPSTVTWLYSTGMKMSIYALYDTAITISPNVGNATGVKVFPSNFPA